jgi:polyferredoxin
MDKMGYARGLVKYTTENAMKNKWTQAQTWHHVLRPSILIYTAILLGIVMAMLVSLTLRTPFKVNVLRDRGVMARIVSGGNIENVYQLQVMNATETAQRYKIRVTGLPGLAITSEDMVKVEST